MKLEKRDEALTPEEAAPSPSEKEPGNKGRKDKQKSVLLYIAILFTLAFGLILVSFFMHQRSNQEVLGELHNNVTAIEQLQDALEENLRLEKELAALEEAQAQAEEAAQAELSRWKEESETNGNALLAMNQLYVLQQQYSAKSFDACQETVDRMEQDTLFAHLPNYPIWEGVASTPAERYQQLKEAVAEKAAE